MDATLEAQLALEAVLFSKISPDKLDSTRQLVYRTYPELAEDDHAYPLVWDADGVLRWECDPFVNFLFPYLDFNRWVASTTVSNSIKRQLAKRLGYSLGGYYDLSYVQEWVEQLEKEAQRGEEEPATKAAKVTAVDTE